MTEITIIRHAQASYGTDDYDRLSDLGHQQARWLGAHWAAQGRGFDHVVRGSLRRHRESAEGIAAHMDLPSVAEDIRLNELSYDSLESGYIQTHGGATPTSRVDFLRQFPEVVEAWSEGRLPDQPEAYDHFQLRVRVALEEAVAHGGRVLIVTSGGVIGTLLRSILGLPLRTSADMILNIFNASVHRVLLEDDRLRLCQFNATPHLDSPDRAHARTYI